MNYLKPLKFFLLVLFENRIVKNDGDDFVKQITL